MNSERIGKFYITTDYMKGTKLRDLSQVLGLLEFVPMRVECLHVRNRFEFIGWSPMFREVPAGEMEPIYELGIESTRYGVSRVVPVEQEF